MPWEVGGTDQFADWYGALSDDEQVDVGRVVDGPALPFPYSSDRVLYAFDPRRAAILLLGGDKTGEDRWYEQHVPGADALYDEHLETLKEEGLL